jgi:hypothetical protein
MIVISPDIGKIVDEHRMMDPVILYYGKGQLSGFLADPDGVLDVVINKLLLILFFLMGAVDIISCINVEQLTNVHLLS